MSDKRPVDNAVLVDRFWHNYFSILEKSRIHKTAVPWYRKHVEAYIKAHPGRRLSSHLPAQIDDYLNAKGRMPALPEWQFRQIADALRLLFCECVRTDWAMAYDWYQWRAFARQLEPDHPTLMRDANPSLLVAPSSNPLIERFRNTYADCHVAFVKTIRVRAMAVRTEQTYEHWITRFLKFHKWKHRRRIRTCECVVRAAERTLEMLAGVAEGRSCKTMSIPDQFRINPAQPRV